MGHPLVSPSRTRAYRLWAQVLHALSTQTITRGELSDVEGDHDCAVFDSEEVNEVVSVAVVTHLQSQSTLLRSAASVAVELISSCSPAGLAIVTHRIIPGLAQSLLDERLHSLTDDEIFKYRNPQAAIAALVSASTVAVAVADIKITNADRKKDSSRASRRGMFGADQVEDEVCCCNWRVSCI